MKNESIKKTDSKIEEFKIILDVLMVVPSFCTDASNPEKDQKNSNSIYRRQQ